MSKDLKILLEELNINYHNFSIYEIAFTHSSMNNGKEIHQDYEKLEFLGDSVLGLGVASLAYNIHKELAQGELTKLKAALVNTKALAKHALIYHFDEYIRVGNSYSSRIKESFALLEDVFEALLGAIYIDLGYSAAYKYVKRFFYEDIKNFDFASHTDFKSSLQEEIQSESRTSLEYKVVKETGPAHLKTFVVEVRFESILLGTGVGHSKKEAEQNAAKEALTKRAER